MNIMIYGIFVQNNMIWHSLTENISETVGLHAINSLYPIDPLHWYITDKDWHIEALDDCETVEDYNYSLYIAMRSHKSLFNIHFGTIEERWVTDVIRMLAKRKQEYDQWNFEYEFENLKRKILCGINNAPYELRRRLQKIKENHDRMEEQSKCPQWTFDRQYSEEG